MLNLIGLFTAKPKTVIGVAIGVIVIVVGGFITYQSNKINKLQSEQVAIKLEFALKTAIYEEEREKAATAIKWQNEAIEKYKVDEAEYTERIREAERSLAEKNYITKKEIVVQLERDPSCENAMRIVNELLDDFAHVEN